LAYGDDATYFDVKTEKSKLDEMLKLSGGVREVPVIVKGDKVTIGYGGT
jgi:glutaredoxin 3